MLANIITTEISPLSQWQACLENIQKKVTPSCFNTWFRNTELAVNGDGRAAILVPNRFFAHFIEENFAALIRETLTESGVDFSELSFEPAAKDWNAIAPIADELAEAQTRKTAVQAAVARERERFHPNYTFDTFIVGDSNTFAQAAALAVAEAPGKTKFNPLVIYGGTGLGKTHLLQAIGHYAQTEGTADSVTYLTSEEFTNQYINYVIHKKDSASFYKKFNNTDMLLIDDIQFFSGKVGTQKEFFRIFNRLLADGKQIVLSSDRQPEKIPDMMEHIINRFMGGLNTDIQPPNLETRMAILRTKAELDGLDLPDEVVQYVAGQITSNVRALEGMLIKLVASSFIHQAGITLEIAKELCGDVLNNREERLSVRVIMQITAKTYGIGVNQLSAHTRKKEVTLPRSVAMYLSKKWTKQSLRSIGLEFGGRDYSTVIHAVKKIEEQLNGDGQAQLRIKLADIEEQLNNV